MNDETRCMRCGIGARLPGRRVCAECRRDDGRRYRAERSARIAENRLAGETIAERCAEIRAEWNEEDLSLRSARPAAWSPIVVRLVR